MSKTKSKVTVVEGDKFRFAIKPDGSFWQLDFDRPYDRVLTRDEAIKVVEGHAKWAAIEKEVEPIRLALAQQVHAVTAAERAAEAAKVELQKQNEKFTALLRERDSKLAQAPIPELKSEYAISYRAEAIKVGCNLVPIAKAKALVRMLTKGKKPKKR